MSGFIIQPQTLLSIGPSRQFGGGASNQPIFKGYVTINEAATDAIEITQQPVQQGAQIADHAFKKPILFSCTIKFSAQTVFSLNPLAAFSGKSPQSLSSIYAQLVALQESFQPFNVTTPKRTYTNMLFATLGMTNDKTTENALAINCAFQQVILVPVGVTTINPAFLSNPGSNSATQQAGNKQLQSSLYSASQILGSL